MTEAGLMAEAWPWANDVFAQCEALAARGGNTRAWRIGPTTLRQYWYSQPRFAGFDRPLAHQPAAEGPARLTVHCVDAADGIDMGTSPFRKRDLGPNRSVQQLASTPLRVLWDQDHHFVQALDLTTGRGFLYVEDFALLPEWEPPIPFRNYLHWWAAAEGHVFLHAGSAGVPEGGIVFLGRGGAGKSTTTLACLEAGLVTCGDDYVLVTRHRPPLVHSVYGTAKLKNAAALRPEGILRRLLPTAQGVSDKTLLFPASEMPETFVRSFPLRALAVLVKGGDVTRIERAGPLDALRAGGPSTVLQMPFGQSEGLTAIAAIAREVPCYRITLGRDLAEVGTVIADFAREIATDTSRAKAACV